MIWEKETEYQYARVLEDARRRAHAGAQRGAGRCTPSTGRGEWLTGGYWDEMLVLPCAGAHAPPRSVAILGNAAGTTARAIGHYFPQTQVDAVEIDPELTEVGRRSST